MKYDSIEDYWKWNQIEDYGDSRLHDHGACYLYDGICRWLHRMRRKARGLIERTTNRHATSMLGVGVPVSNTTRSKQAESVLEDQTRSNAKG
jgi:hypothetical protein